MPSLENANVGKAVATRVGANIREVRTKLTLTQSQLAAPTFSISYISAIERGKIRPSLKALSILAQRLDVPLTFLLEGNPSGAAEARAVGYSPADSGPDQRVDIDLLQAGALVQQEAYAQAAQLLAPLQPARITTDQVYHLYLLRGQIHRGEKHYQEAVVDLRAAVEQGEAMSNSDYSERARNLLGEAYFQLHNYTLAVENHLCSHTAIESGHINDPLFAFDVLSNLANDYFRLGDLDKAIGYYHRALEVIEDLGRDSRRYAEKYMKVSQSAKAAGKMAIAREYAMRSLAAYDMRDEQRLVGLTHQHLGKTLEKQHKLDEAEQEYQQAIELERDLGDEAATSQCYTALAELLLKREDRQGAEAATQKALRFAEQSNDAQTEGQALIVWAEIRHQAADYTGADEACEKALDLLDRAPSRELAAGAYFQYANQLENRGEVQRSLNAIKKAYEHQRQGKRGDSE